MKLPRVGGTVRFLFTTHDASGAAVAPSSAFEAADVRIYKDGSATQRSSESGFTMTSPFGSLTGLHLIAIDLSDNTDNGFYAAGSEYDVVLSPDETVDGVSVIRVIGSFRIMPAEGIVGHPKVDVGAWLGTAAATPEVAGVPEVGVADDGIDANSYAADLDHYAAKVWVQDKNSSTATDRYTVIWTKNGVDLTSGITSPTIQVIKRSDGTDLVASGAMTEIASLGLYKKDETSNLMVPGESYIIKVQATIDGATRTSYWVQGRDVAA